MSVYVDPAIWRWRGTFWCHLSADTLDELHAFAQSIGLKRAWFQCPPEATYPHYDMVAARRRHAVENGAIQVSSRELLVKARQLLTQFTSRARVARSPRSASAGWCEGVLRAL